MIFRKEPFFYGHDNYDQLVKIAKVMSQGSAFSLINIHDLAEDHSGAACQNCTTSVCRITPQKISPASPSSLIHYQG